MHRVTDLWPPDYILERVAAVTNEQERIAAIRVFKTEFDKTMCRMAELMAILQSLGAVVALNYNLTPDGENGDISLLCSLGDAPPGLFTQPGAVQH